MPLPQESDIGRQMFEITRAGMIPIRLQMIERQSNTLIDEDLVACRSVPRNGEIVEHGQQRWQVVGVQHAFQEAQMASGVAAKNQFISVAIMKG